MDLTGVLPISESGAERLAEGDHIGEDGLVYCGKCGSRKQRQKGTGLSRRTLILCEDSLKLLTNGYSTRSVFSMELS